MNNQFENEFEEVKQLLNLCEVDNNLEMGILSSLFYLGPIRKHAEKALKLEHAQ